MKSLLLPAVFGVLGLGLPLAAHAQSPFNSGGAPGANPFNQHYNLPSNPSPQQQGTQVQPGTAVPGGYPNAQPLLSSEPVEPNHHLGRGDSLSYRVAEDRDPTLLPLVVSDTGEVNIPLLGPVKAAGKSTSQLTADIKASLDRTYYYHATVYLNLDRVAIRSRGKVYLSGAVKGAGATELPSDAQLTVTQLITQAGGFVDFSDQKHVKIIRKGGPAKGIVVNVRAVLDGKLNQDVVLEPGDTVVVPEAHFKVTF